MPRLNLIAPLDLSNKPLPEAPNTFPVILACGSPPLPLQTFLHAHLRQALPDRRIQIKTGLFGDLAGTLERVPDGSHDALVVPLEWPAPAAPIGFRPLGRSPVADLPDTLTPV